MLRASVIVPVRDRRDLLAALLGSLAAQTATDFEVIVVDDGSTDGADELAATTTIAGRPVRLLRSPGRGAVEARVAGIEAAATDVLVFTDSDCVASPGWLAALLAAVDDGADMVVGPTRPARRPRPLERSLWADEEGMYPTCNAAYRRAAFEAVGGFDSGAASWLGFRHDEQGRGRGFGEDTLLGWRVRRAGFDFRFAPGALVHHHVFPPDLPDTISRTWQMASFPALLAEIPELRATTVHHGVLFGPRSRVPVYAAALAAVARRPALLAAALAWWAGLRAWETRGADTTRAEKLAAVPGEMAVDAVAAAALLVGSAKAKHLLL